MSLLHFFRRPDYRSDTTQFIDQLKIDRPHLEAAQKEARALLWNASVDRHVLKEFNEGRVDQNLTSIKPKAESFGKYRCFCRASARR